MDLLETYQSGKLADVQKAIDNGAKITNINDIIDEVGSTPLIWACENGLSEIAQFLINNGADVNVQDWYSYTPLHGACKNGLPDVALLLIKKGADVNAKDHNDETPLMSVCRAGYHKIAKHLIDLCDEENLKRKPPLIRFCKKVLTKIHQSIETPDPRKRRDYIRFLEISALKLDEVVQLLIDKGADVNAKDNLGNTPLILASGKGLYGAAKLLIDSGANVNAKKHDRNSALSEACKQGSYYVAELLIKNGADVNAKDSEGRPPIFWASFQKFTEISKLLIKNGARLQ